MRERHGWDGHGEHRRHAHDAAADAHASRAHDGPKHAANDALKLKMLLDPEARRRESLKAQRAAEASDPLYIAKHVRAGGADRGQAPDQQTRPRKARPEHAPWESRDKPNSRITGRRDSLESQEKDRPKLQRSRLPRADAVKGLTDIAATIAGIAVALGDIPSKWDAVAVLAAGAVVSNLTWAHRRWKDRHGDRSES